MNLWIAMSVGFKEIWAYKFRSLLTMLGIILGVSSLVAMSALVQGMEKGAKESLIAIGGLQKIRVESQELPIEQRHLRDQAVGMTINDVYALQKSAPLVEAVSPEMRSYGALLSAKGKKFRPWNLVGVWPIAAKLSEHVVEHGRMFNEVDDEMARSVCVIGTDVRDELFGSPEDVGHEIIPIGETVAINNQPFTIIGMFQHYESEQDRKKHEIDRQNPGTRAKTGPTRSRGWSGGGNWAFKLKNSTVYIPLNTMWLRFRASGAPGSWRNYSTTAPQVVIPDPRLSNLEVKITDLDRMNAALQQVHNVLMATHKGIEDFAFRTSEETIDRINTYIRNARVSRGVIAGISLLVGGIGIMNIMLASISGRIREIGIRKAVGASTSAIFTQIVIESVVIAMLGGVLGLLSSYGLVRMLTSFSPTDNVPIITVPAMLFAFTASVCIGMMAGLFPAFKAARLNPIQALRYE
ncbi:MAG: ABC transporter permease [Verrucomicrobiota bacterium]